MNYQKNIALVRKLFDEIYTKGNLDFIDEYFTSDVKLNDPAVANFKGGLAGLKEKEGFYKKAFPNKTTKINEIFGVDDKVVVYWTSQGTQKGELQGFPPSGRNYKISGISIYHFSNGKIDEITQNWDRLSLLEQIGAVEPSFALHR